MSTAAIVAQEIAAQHGEILEHTETERKQGDVVQVDAEAVADKDERRREQGVREEARHKDALVEPLGDNGAQSTEGGVEGGDEGDGEDLRIRNGNDERAAVADHEPEENADDNDVDHLLSSSRSAVSRA